MNTYIAPHHCHRVTHPHDLKEAVDVSWNPAGHRVLHSKAAQDPTSHKQEGEAGEGASIFLSQSAALVRVLGSQGLTQRWLYAHSSSHTSFANKQAQDTAVLAALRGASRAQSRRQESLVALAL